MKPLAYLLTWTTYGTWLHGDERGWVHSGQSGIQAPDFVRQESVRMRMTEQAIILDEGQRLLVEKTIREVCQLRRWEIHAINVRSNHVHIVLSAELSLEQVLSQLKAWCSRRLSEQIGLLADEDSRNGRKRWWTEHGSTKWINDENYLQNAIRYVNDRQ
ncbi:MAG TPA: transposase [Gemmataceae bacterium]|jgi:REP element-mobilizing transposase RayT